jgi:hypothetical protein
VSDAMIDDLLDELVPPVEQLPNWDGILRRARRVHRRRVALAVLAVALVAVPSGYAIARAFEGTPAPQRVSNAVRVMNGMADQANAYAAQQGFAAHEPHAIVSTVHGVVQVQTPDGPVDLWAASSDSGGTCYLFDWETDTAGADGVARAGGTCDDRLPASGLGVGWEWSAEHPDYKVVYGRTTLDAATVDVDLADGTATSLPVVEHLFLGIVPNAQRIVAVRAFDATGTELAAQTFDSPPH